MKDLLIAILILAALIALFSLNDTPIEDTPTEGWGAIVGGYGRPYHGDGDGNTPVQAEPIQPQTTYKTSPVTGYWEVNPMYISWQTIITAGAVVSALLLMLGILAKVYKWYLKQNRQDEKIIDLEEHHNEDIRQLKKEFRLVCEALSACLDGLIQQGCNHTVPKAKQKLDEYLNQQAHE